MPSRRHMVKIRFARRSEGTPLTGSDAVRKEQTFRQSHTPSVRSREANADISIRRREAPVALPARAASAEDHPVPLRMKQTDAATGPDPHASPAVFKHFIGGEEGSPSSSPLVIQFPPCGGERRTPRQPTTFPREFSSRSGCGPSRSAKRSSGFPSYSSRSFRPPTINLPGSSSAIAKAPASGKSRFGIRRPKHAVSDHGQRVRATEPELSARPFHQAANVEPLPLLGGIEDGVEALPSKISIRQPGRLHTSRVPSAPPANQLDFPAFRMNQWSELMRLGVEQKNAVLAFASHRLDRDPSVSHCPECVALRRLGLHPLRPSVGAPSRPVELQQVIGCPQTTGVPCRPP